MGQAPFHNMQLGSCNLFLGWGERGSLHLQVKGSFGNSPAPFCKMMAESAVKPWKAWIQKWVAEGKFSGTCAWVKNLHLNLKIKALSILFSSWPHYAVSSLSLNSHAVLITPQALKPLPDRGNHKGSFVNKVMSFLSFVTVACPHSGPYYIKKSLLIKPPKPLGGKFYLETTSPSTVTSFHRLAKWPHKLPRMRASET